jgi:hypothetical protein
VHTVCLHHCWQADLHFSDSVLCSCVGYARKVQIDDISNLLTARSNMPTESKRNLTAGERKAHWQSTCRCCTSRQRRCQSCSQSESQEGVRRSRMRHPHTAWAHRSCPLPCSRHRGRPRLHTCGCCTSGHRSTGSTCCTMCRPHRHRDQPLLHSPSFESNFDCQVQFLQQEVLCDPLQA